jgi:2-oxoglutarate dehydrogenase E1 component
VRALLRRRLALASKSGLVDWATAETLAYATLLTSGTPVRLSGQDAERVTFGHRHAVVHDSETGETYTPLASLPGANAPFTVHNSPLTESAVLAFEFGYSLESQDGLVIWEAQFGDFANVAQVVIDQFIVSSEAKWHQSTNLCLFLPHGLEGQGPEHSSARPERFLQLCASENIAVAAPTTASQLFHLLRRQAHLNTRRPTIIFTPKKLLSQRSLSSPLEDLGEGQFEPILCDGDPTTAGRVLLCTGTIGLALVNERDARQTNAAIIRLEQLYPFPSEEIRKDLEGREADRPLVWVQEEPENMGGWTWVREQLRQICPGRPIHGVARPESATPATGSFALHQKEQSILLDRAFC